MKSRAIIFYTRGRSDYLGANMEDVMGRSVVPMINISVFSSCSDAIWRHRPGSKLVQVKTTWSNVYLWFVQFWSSRLRAISQVHKLPFYRMSFKTILWKLQPHTPWGQWAHIRNECLHIGHLIDTIYRAEFCRKLAVIGIYQWVSARKP